jgi:phosphohistidine phosphatase SixA
MTIRLSRIGFITFILIVVAFTASAQPTVYLVRHAEKLANWPSNEALDAFHPLSAEGAARAKKLAEQFKPGSISAIFSSRTTRSLHTAFPLSQKLHLSIEVVDACMDTAAILSFYKNLARRFKPDQAIILVSHSNIIPYLLIKAGLPSSCLKEMGIKISSPSSWLLVEGYDNIWKVEKLRATGRTCEGFVRLKF